MIIRDKIFKPQELKSQDFVSNKYIHCTFSGVNLHFTSFANSTFEACDFTNCILDNTRFNQCAFPESKLSYLDFSPALFLDCDFTHTVMKDSVFQQFKPGTNENVICNLVSCRFKETDLEHSQFIWCNLEKISFQGSNLKQVLFDRCRLKEADFTEAELAGANFDSSKLDHTILDVDGFIAVGLTKGFVLQ